MKCIEIIRQIVLSSALRDEPSVMNKLVLRYKTYAINIGLPHYHAKTYFDLLCTHLQLRRLACRIHHRAMTWHCKSAFDIDGLWWLLIDAIFHHIVKYFVAIPHCNIILFDVNLIFEWTLFDIIHYIDLSTWYFVKLLIWENEKIDK